MKKRWMSIILAAGCAAILAAGTVMAAGAGTRLNAKYEGGAQEAGPGITEIIAVDENGEAVEPEHADRYVETNPVRKWGNVISYDKEAKQIHLNSHETGTDESGKEIMNFEQEIVLNVADNVPVLDAATGFPVAWEDIDKTAPVYAWVSQAMSLSLPPQTAAQLIVVNVPADYAAPQYVAVKDVKTESDGSVKITDQDGNVWSAAADTPVTPYLTRNMVYLSDVQPGRFCLIWPKAGSKDQVTDGGQQYEAGRITLFAW